MTIRQRFHAWFAGKLDAAVQRHIPDPLVLMLNAIQHIDRKDLAWHVDTPDFRKNVAQFVKEGLEADIDLGEIAEKVGERIDASDIAYHLDTADVAANVDIDIVEVASRVADDLDMSSLAEELDYDKLAMALVCKLKEAWTN